MLSFEERLNRALLREYFEVQVRDSCELPEAIKEALLWMLMKTVFTLQAPWYASLKIWKTQDGWEVCAYEMAKTDGALYSWRWGEWPYREAWWILYSKEELEEYVNKVRSSDLSPDKKREYAEKARRVFQRYDWVPVLKSTMEPHSIPEFLEWHLRTWINDVAEQLSKAALC